MGRRRFIPQLRASDRGSQALGERLAVNTVFQGSAADLIKKAMIDIHHALKNDKWKSAMLLQIHDELLFESPLEEVKKLTALVKQKMEGALKLEVPLVVDVGAGDDWLSAKVGAVGCWLLDCWLLGTQAVGDCRLDTSDGE